MFQCFPQMQPSAEASGIGRFPDSPRSIKLRAKMAGLSDSILQRKRTSRSGLSAPALFRPGRILRQPDLHRRAALDQLGQRLLDANRTIGQPKKITMIFGRKVTKYYNGKLQTVIEDLDLPNPVIRSQ